jgi:4-hydroxybenzoate polyprenyltransferase
MIFLKLIGYRNLVWIALAQLIFHFGFLKQQGFDLALKDWQFLLLVLATLCIAAGGFLIQNILDKSSRPSYNQEKKAFTNTVSEAKAYNLYAALNIIGVGIGFYLSNLIEKASFAGIFIVAAATLYIYASSLKKNLLVGNLIIATILALCVLIVGIYDLFPLVTPENQPYLRILFGIFIDYASFVFLISFIRELVCSFATIEDDLDNGSKTLPIVIGQKNTKIIVSVLIAFVVMAAAHYSYYYMFSNDLYIASFYMMASVLAPLIYSLIRLWNVSENKEYNQLSLILQAVLIFGMLSILVIEFTK